MNPKKTSGDDKEWQKGLSLFVQLSSWLVGPLIAALFLGNWLDQKFNTKPWLFLATTGFAFLITAFGLVKETTQYIKELEKEAKIKNNNLDNNEQPRS
ncbi:MAG: AtpZ/AtpI family protein [Candidatus Buchananbacteria bacterium]